MKNIIFLGVIIVALAAATLAQKKSQVCMLPHSANGSGKASCKAMIPSWSFDKNSNKCVKFTYGGCGGNRNRFGSQGECERKCLSGVGK